jgi:hypothetical protein
MNLKISWKCVVAALVCGAVSVPAAPRLGRAVVTVQIGEADYQALGQDWKSLHRGMAMTEGATARTGTNTVVDLSLTTDARMRVTSKTIIRLDQLREETQGLPERGKKPTALTNIELERGKILVRTGAPTEKSSFTVSTRSCIREVRGFGAYSVYLLNNRACVCVRDQTVTLDIRGRADPVVLQAGQQLCVDCDPRTNQAVDPYARPTTITEPDPDWDPPWTPPPGGPPVIKIPPVYEIRELSPTTPPPPPRPPD